ncbi:type II secretion system protein [Verrucomicrobiales bacterium BCK34]|nr:type II secretion system protein [Verrucomicrobiales bacterium BCK34]
MKARWSRGMNGFTMVEVLVVIAIVGLLAAILIPSFNRMKRSAQSTLCVGKLREIGIGLNTYFLDHGNTFPTLVAARESREEDNPAIDTVLLDYVVDEYAFQCPSDHMGIFEKTGSSYFWNSLINGQKTANMDMLGLTDKASGIPIASDKENFHEHVGDGVNMLYADGHVLRELQFIVEEP